MFTVQNKMQLLVPYILCVHLFVFYACDTDKFRPGVSDGMNQVVNYGSGIVGGTPTTIEKAPYLAAILKKDGTYRGIGAVVGKRFILTSAHMENHDIDTTDKVRVGTSDFTTGGQLINIEAVTKHEKYDGLYSHDIALLRLGSDIEYKRSVKAIKLATTSTKVGTSTNLTGFAPSLVNNSFYLTEGIQTIVDVFGCQDMYVDEQIPLDHSNICVYNTTVCACRKDVAAPLVQENKLIGFFVGGSFCCENQKPQICVNLARVNAWIKKHLAEQGHDEEDNAGYYFGE